MSFLDATLAESLELLIMKLSSDELLSFARQERFHADLDRWLNILRRIYPVLEDAEEKQTTNPVVKTWLADLKNLVYDVDEFASAALERKLSHQPAEASTSKLRRKLLPTCCANFKPRSINVKMRSKIKEITARLEVTAVQKKDLVLRDRDHIYIGDHIYGGERDREAFLELLLKDGGREDPISVIPISGRGGVGKTTLAQIAYKDVMVQSQFEIKAWWACGSDDFDVTGVTQAILESISGTAVHHSDLNKLQVQLMEKLVKKKFLIVLDDIWDLNYDKWTCLLRPFRAGSSESKIIVTTRFKQISSMVATVPIHRLKELSYDRDDDIQNKKKNSGNDGDRDGDRNGYKGNEDVIGGGKMNGKKMDFMGKSGFGYNYAYHAGYENGYVVGQLQCVQAVLTLFILFYILKYHKILKFDGYLVQTESTILEDSREKMHHPKWINRSFVG